jgi:hypothetical protein
MLTVEPAVSPDASRLPTPETFKLVVLKFNAVEFSRPNAQPVQVGDVIGVLTAKFIVAAWAAPTRQEPPNRAANPILDKNLI